MEMTRAEFIAKKHELWGLVKKVSEDYGGEDFEDLKNYFNELINKYPADNINTALDCFREVVK